MDTPSSSRQKFVPVQNNSEMSSSSLADDDRNELSDGDGEIFSDSEDHDYSSELEDLWNKKTSRENSVESTTSSTITTPRPGQGQVVPMIVDTDEALWSRINDISVEGTIFHYIGEGKSIKNNGFAQNSVALNPTQNYFEITILDPGENCYIAIGLARKDYPMQKHPGWNRGSVSYHADDGKLFHGGGVGTAFGPPSSKFDVIGCGIVFPSHISDSITTCSDSLWPWEKNPDLPPRKAHVRRRRCRPFQNDDVNEHSSDSEDEIWWLNRNQVYFDDKVFVFFRRNGVLLGIKEVRIPKGGFFPTIGMLSRGECVQVNLNPLSG